MKPLDLTADPVAAAVRARQPQPATIVWVYDEEIHAWAVLRAALDTGVVHTLCLRSFAPRLVGIRTSSADPSDPRRPLNTCPACETELAAGTPGAAIAIEPDDVAIARAATVEVSRVKTDNIRGPRRPASDPPEAWDQLLWDPESREASS